LKLKWIIPALLASIWLIALAACGSGNNNKVANAPAPAASSASTLAARAATPGAPARAAASSPTAAPAAATSAATSPAATLAKLGGSLTVFAAASLTDAFNEIGPAFQQQLGVKVTFNYGASSTLATQLAQGAPADLFASADQPNMEKAKQAGVIDGPDRLFAKNKLVVIVPKANPAKIQTLQDLAKPGINFVLTDPSVPIGSYARQALAKMAQDPAFGAGFDQKVLANLKSQEANVRAVVSKVQLGEADAAITYATDVTPDAAKDVQSIAIPDQFNVIAAYPIAVVKGAQNPAAAQAFIAYLRSPDGQAVLKKWGFILDADTGQQ
jgi:molybdate transport system substrate-binding protein